MIVKKLAAPLINEKILQQAEHCYIATTSLSTAGFDFIRTRIPTKTKLSIVTGADEPTSPEILRNILRHYQDRIIFTVYTRNYFHANLFIFDLPFRKSVAFIGSGHLTLGGLKDQEEIFFRISDIKEIEALKSWFTGYFEFGEPLSEKFIDEYELAYPDFRKRQIQSRIEKREIAEITSRAFSWDAIRFKNQFFKKEDYDVLAIEKSASMNPLVVEAREAVKAKFETLLTALKGDPANAGLDNSDAFLPITPPLNREGRIKKIGLTLPVLSRDKEASLQLEVILSRKEFSVVLFADIGEGRTDREILRHQLAIEEYRKNLLPLLQGLGKKYTVEIAGDKRLLDLFQSTELLAEFLREDDWRFGRIVIGKSFNPGDAEINNEALVSTVTNEIKKLAGIYNHLVPHKTS